MKSILLIDKDIITRKFLQRTLQERGYTVSQAESGKEGLVLAWRDQPDIIVADPSFPDIDPETFIQKIRLDARTASTPVVALSGQMDKEFAQVSLAQGYSVYLPKSGSAITELLKLLKTLDTDTAPTPGTKQKEGKIITFISAKGGTGTSSLCANIAMNMAKVRPDAKLAVVDMVLPIGSIASLVGYEGSIDLTTVADLPADEISAEFLKNSLPQVNLWNFHLLAGAPTPETANLLQVGNIPSIIQGLKESFDYIIIDLGRSLSRISLPLIQDADLIVFVLGTDQGTVKITKTVIEYLRKLNVDSKKVYPILNRAIGLEGLTKADAEKDLGIEIKMTVPYMGGNFTIANNQAEPVSHKFPQNTASIMLHDLAESILRTVHAYKKISLRAN